MRENEIKRETMRFYEIQYQKDRTEKMKQR